MAVTRDTFLETMEWFTKENFHQKRVDMIKYVRTVTPLGLKDSARLVESMDYDPVKIADRIFGVSNETTIVLLQEVADGGWLKTSYHGPFTSLTKAMEWGKNQGGTKMYLPLRGTDG